VTDDVLNALIERYTLRVVLHSLTNVCYARSERAARAALLDANSAALYEAAETWQALGQRAAKSAQIAKEALL